MERMKTFGVFRLHLTIRTIRRITEVDQAISKVDSDQSESSRGSGKRIGVAS